MKKNIYINRMFLITTLLVLITFWILSLSNMRAGNLTILKVYFIAQALFAIFLFLAITRIYKEALLSNTEILKTCEDLKKILFDLRDGTKTFYEERRSARRIKDCVTIKIVHNGSSQFVKALDISETGVRFRTGSKLLRDSLLDLNVYLSLFPQPINVKGKVARLYKPLEGSDTFDVGVEFLDISDSDKEKLKETMKILEKS